MFLSVAFVAFSLTAPPPPFEFKDGDRIVWLGNTLVEREQRFGYWETALIVANPDKKLTFRNLGWSGDTVFGDARAGFDNAAKGFERMVGLTLELKPTVIAISYGTNESFEGKDGLPKFEKGLEKLLDALKPANARIVLYPPLPPESGVPASRNADVKMYADAIQAIAKQRNLTFIDPGIALARQMANQKTPLKLTDNGMHLNEAGYRLTTPAILESMGYSTDIPDWNKLEPLRQAVLVKNDQFFNKWRPQNETYLFGFRKHEQGRNAKEIAEFDPFIAKAEDEIEKLRKALK